MAAQHPDLPYFAEGEVVSGFGRGSKELGIPTANFPESVIRQLPSAFECGVYYGWAKLSSYPQVFKMTMCVGWNPYYQNTVKTMETHIIHQFDSDFYGDIMKIIVLGFIRPMCDFPSLDALIKAIHNDIEEAKKLLDTEKSLEFKDNPFFVSFKPNIVSEKGIVFDSSQSITSEVDGQPSENSNDRDANQSNLPQSTINSETGGLNGCANLSDDEFRKDDPGVRTGIDNTIPHNVESSAKRKIEGYKSNLSNGGFSQQVPNKNCSENLKDSI